ncbi:MAG: ABC transporter substrate-binding protein [Candidatus Latescibacteria bacterium]|nr:ABC transporter substrate-binding protein [Candidatus Latescibacterota bacterium]
MSQVIRLGHSPDADDAFMFYPIAAGLLDTEGFAFVHVVEEIERLNRRALNEELEVTAVSIHAYAYIADRYALLPCGASMGDRYGPILVAKERIPPDDLREKKIAVPGTMTTAFLTLRLFAGNVHYEVFPFDQILGAVIDGRVDVGLLIHEGQLTYKQMRLEKVADLGEWWFEETGLPLPLGGNVIRKDLGEEVIHRIARLLTRSVEIALERREEALAYAMQYGRGMDTTLTDQFVGMYVNDYTLNYGDQGRRAIEELLKRGYEYGVVPRRVRVEFIE